MAFWNRREVYCGNSVSAFHAVGNSLTQNGIPFTTKQKRHNVLPGQAGGRTSIESAATLYYIYVDKQHAEQAAHLSSKAVRDTTA